MFSMIISYFDRSMPHHLLSYMHHHHLLSYIDVLEGVHEVPNPQREVHVRLVMQRVHVVLHEVVGSGVDACNK